MEDSIASKKLALLYILEILKQYSDVDHPLLQEDIARYLDQDYNLSLERKAVSRNLSLLQEADFEIVSDRKGSYLLTRDFEDSELQLLIDAVNGCRFISKNDSLEITGKLAKLSNCYFQKKQIRRHIYSDDDKTENRTTVYNIGLVNDAIDEKRLVVYKYAKYGKDKKLHEGDKTHHVFPYRMVLHNQKYYLVGYCEEYGKICYHRLDHIVHMELGEKKPGLMPKNQGGTNSAIPQVPKVSTLPYMFSDPQEKITFVTNTATIDQVIDWFGMDIQLSPYTGDPEKEYVTVTTSPTAMKYWALQYLDAVEVISPISLRNEIREILDTGVQKYSK